MTQAKTDQRYWDRAAAKYDHRSAYGEGALYNECIQLVKRTVERGATIVDLGCGTGLIAFNLTDMASFITGIDYSEAMISMARAKQSGSGIENTKFYQGDAHRTGLENHVADISLLCNIIHYSKSPDELLLEAKRLTKPNGMVITSTDCYASIRSIRGFFVFMGLLLARSLRLVPWFRFYTFKSLREELENSGMVIIAERKLKYFGVRGLFAVLKT
jgi:ubiquinone/menaquinone biosynthesis C-methylase UbiE